MSHLDAVTPQSPARIAPILNLTAKTLLVILLLTAVLSPAAMNLDGKAAEARAIGYPLLAFGLAGFWYLTSRPLASFPWRADLMLTVPCFSDTLGNRMDLYDRIWWFDDVVHFVNTGLIAGAVVLLTLPATTTFWRALERGLAVGVTAALAWEIAEYFAFLSKHVERNGAYADTLADMALGTAGTVVAVVLVYYWWQRNSEDSLSEFQVLTNR